MKEKGYYAESYEASREWTNEALLRVSKLLHIPIIDMNTFTALDTMLPSRCEDIHGNVWELSRGVFGVGVKEYSYESFGGMNIDGRSMKGKADLVLFLPDTKIRVEFRYQDKPGTADEKHAYFLLQSELCEEFDHNILICEGSYIRKCRKQKAFEKLAEDYQNSSIVLGLDAAERRLMSLTTAYSNSNTMRESLFPAVSVCKCELVNYKGDE